MADIKQLLETLNHRLDRIETKLTESSKPELTKDWFTIREVAELLMKAPFTVREWARLGRVNALKRPSGRSGSSEWMISKRELERIRNKGLLPRDL